MCELVLGWAHQKWLNDDSVEIDETFMGKSTLLFMSKNNSLKDCKEVEEGSAQDSDLIQDYKKSYQHLDKPKVYLSYNSCIFSCQENFETETACSV